MEPIHVPAPVSVAPPRSRGFTLIELLVVFALIIVMMAVVFTNQGSFNKTLVLSATAYDIALTIRDAATYGLGSRASGTTINTGYGIHFDQTTPRSFIFFADTSPAASCSTPDCKTGDGTYTSGADTLVSTYALGNGITVSDFCAYTTSWTCTSARGGAGNNLTALDVSFARPNPTPSITAFAGASGSTASAACLVISSSFSTARYVAIAATGQVSVNTTSCP